MSGAPDRRSRWRRRAVSVPALVAAAILLTVTIPIWLPLALLVDLVRLKRRCPIARLLAFGWCWTWIELGGLGRALVAWMRGRASDHETHYRLMDWWAGALMRAMTRTIGIRPRIEGLDALAGGNAIVLCRHASLADSLLSAWAIRCQAGLRPRYVLKRELLGDPCLDVVGLRIPNHFLDRSAPDAALELAALRRLAAGVGPGVVAVIFPEGTRANPDKRRRALAKIAERDPERAARLQPLQRLLPPRPSGSAALIDGAPDADVVLAWHTGFDGLDTFSGILNALSRRPADCRFVARRVGRRDVPSGAAFEAWLDARWLELDAAVDGALGTATDHRPNRP